MILQKMRTTADATAKSANADAAAKWVFAQKGRTAYSATKKGAQWHNLCSTGAVQARVEKLRGVSVLCRQALVVWLASQLGRELEALADQQVAGQAARPAAGVWGRGVRNRCFSAP